MKLYDNTYRISVNAFQDIDLINDIEEREELEELIDEEITEAYDYTLNLYSRRIWECKDWLGY